MYSLGKNIPELKSNSCCFFQKPFFLIRLITSLHGNLSYKFFTKVVLLLLCATLSVQNFRQTDFQTPLLVQFNDTSDGAD